MTDRSTAVINRLVMLVAVLLLAAGCSDSTPSTEDPKSQQGPVVNEPVADLPSEAVEEPAQAAASEKELHGGMTLTQWIEQSKSGDTLQQRQDALQVLRNIGLGHDRQRVLQAFEDALDEPELAALAAAGFRKAGPPVKPEVMTKFYELIENEFSKADADAVNIGVVMRILGAIGAVGDSSDVEKLRKLASDQRSPELVKPMSQKAIGEIRQRMSEEAL